MKNNKKNVIIISCIAVVGILLVILLLFSNNEVTSNEKKLLIDCSQNFELDNHDQIFKVELYSEGEDRYLIQKLIMKPNVVVDEDSSKEIQGILSNKLKLQIEKLTQVNQFIDYDVYVEENEYISEISYIINNENFEDMYKILEYDYFSNSIDDIILNIEKGGMKCLKQ